MDLSQGVEARIPNEVAKKLGQLSVQLTPNTEPKGTTYEVTLLYFWSGFSGVFWDQSNQGGIFLKDSI